MKHSEEWGTGKILIHPPVIQEINSRTHIGGNGVVLDNGRPFGGFCLKLVSLLDSDDKVSSLFWQEAKSVSLYTSSARNIPGCVTCPVPARYWIHEDDFLCRNITSSDGGRLSDFISLFNIKPDQLKKLNIDPKEYRYIPADLLNSVYHEYELSKRAVEYLPQDLHREIFDHKIKADILLTYPVLKCRRSLDNVKSDFFEDDRKAGRLIYRVLSSILALYRCGLAHGDIKPGNIMISHTNVWEREDDFFLTDIGSFHSGAVPSSSGTNGFFRAAVYNSWSDEADAAETGKDKNAVYCKQNKRFIGENGFQPADHSPEELNTLLKRTLMDGYALAATLWMCAAERTPSGRHMNSLIISEHWGNPVITGAFAALCNVRDLTIGKMQKIVDDLAAEFSFVPETESFFETVSTYGKESEFKIDVKKIQEEEIQEVSRRLGNETTAALTTLQLEYGNLTEQFNVSGIFNPVVRLRKNLPPYGVREYQTVIMQPIITAYSNGQNFISSIYYAPDDAVTGKRPEDFTNYIPHTLDHDISCNKLNDRDFDELLAFGRRINNCASERSHNAIIPYPRDIVKVDGKWIIQPFFLDCAAMNEKISFEEYFKMLCGRENALTEMNWIDLLAYDRGVGILYELIPEDMVRRVSALLLQKVVDDGDRILKKLLRDLSKTNKFGPCLKND